MTRTGYLRSVLQALNVPVESQLMVFSKARVQAAYTSPANPRALFFNDSVVVGFLRRAPVLELAAHDPRQGTSFYTLAQNPQGRAVFTRSDVCLSCHVSYNSLDVPGMLVRSQFTAADGRSMRQLGEPSRSPQSVGASLGQLPGDRDCRVEPAHGQCHRQRPGACPTRGA